MFEHGVKTVPGFLRKRCWHTICVFSLSISIRCYIETGKVNSAAVCSRTISSTIEPSIFFLILDNRNTKSKTLMMYIHSGVLDSLQRCGVEVIPTGRSLDGVDHWMMQFNIVFIASWVVSQWLENWDKSHRLKLIGQWCSGYFIPSIWSMG